MRQAIQTAFSEPPICIDLTNVPRWGASAPSGEPPLIRETCCGVCDPKKCLEMDPRRFD